MTEDVVDDGPPPDQDRVLCKRQVHDMGHTVKIRRAHQGEVAPIIARLGTVRSQNQAIGDTAERRETLLDRRRPGQVTLTYLR